MPWPWAYVGNDKGTISNIGLRVWLAVVVGLVLAQVVSRLTEYYTATHFKPVKDIAESARTGPATVVLSGTATGLESSVYAVIAIAIAIGDRPRSRRRQPAAELLPCCTLRHGHACHHRRQSCRKDTFGPVSDNAAGIAEMSGEFHGDAERIMVSLDAVGNTTKAVTKGFAIGSAVIGAVAIFASFIEGAVKGGAGALSKLSDIELKETIEAAEKLPRGVFDLLPINVADPKTFIGLLIGGAVPFLFSALAIRAVSRTAGVVVEEVRKQFADGKIMKPATKDPDYECRSSTSAPPPRCVSWPPLRCSPCSPPWSSASASTWRALGAFSAAVILVGQLMANYLSNAGGAWDNAKKYIEDGHHGGKGSDPHKAAVIGDTVGDPFKDTAGPALNPLIKVMNLVSLLDAAGDHQVPRTTTRCSTTRSPASALAILIGRRRS